MLLDTVALVRLIAGELPPRVVDEMEASDVLAVSAVSLFEINQKVRLGKLAVPTMDAPAVVELTARGVAVLPLTPEVMLRAGAMEWQHAGRDHRDPFDRMIAATALELPLPVATSDRAFADLKGQGLRVVAI